MKQDQIKEHFSRQADGYEKLMAGLIPQYSEQHKIIYDLLPEEEKEYKVLDLGCGNGVLSEQILKKYHRAHITGFDITEAMLKAYENKLSQYSGRFELKMGDFRTDAIGSNYDIILAGLTLHHLTHKERKEFYKKLYSALNTGGIFISRDIIIDEDKAVRTYQYDLWKKFIKSNGGDPEFWYLKHTEKDYPVTLSEHFNWLKEAGFVEIGCYYRLFNFAITMSMKF
ncbi:MAG: class I SAM-dependent methyltransferase [Deltaproteobacteria bacterium]|nr:class I SAM-dependent methyltransferase [Deltaproteobacteria bacterium]